MNTEHIKAIEELVDSYIKKHDLVLPGDQVRIDISVQRNTVTVVKFSDPDSDKLNWETNDVFTNYFNLYRTEVDKRTATRIKKLLQFILKSDEPTIRDLVYFSHRDRDWLKFRGMSKKYLEYIDECLSQMGLTRLPKPH